MYKKAVLGSISLQTFEKGNDEVKLRHEWSYECDWYRQDNFTILYEKWKFVCVDYFNGLC